MIGIGKWTTQVLAYIATDQELIELIHIDLLNIKRIKRNIIHSLIMIMHEQLITKICSIIVSHSHRISMEEDS